MYGVSFSPNNHYVVSGSGDHTVRIWSVKSGDCIKTLKGHTNWVSGVSFSPIAIVLVLALTYPNDKF